MQSGVDWGLPARLRPTVCGQRPPVLCTACIMAAIHPPAAELIPAGMRPTVCGHRPPVLCTAGSWAATHRRPYTANGRRAPTRPPAANILQSFPAICTGLAYSPPSVLHAILCGCGVTRPVCSQQCAANARLYYGPPASWLRYTPLPPSSYPPVCGQLCAAIGSRFYAQRALGLLLIAGRLRQTAAELLPARLLPAVCHLSQQYAPA